MWTHSGQLSIINPEFSSHTCHLSSACNRQENKNAEVSGEDTSLSLEKSEFCAVTTSSHFPDRQVDYPHFMGKEIKIQETHSSEESERHIYRPTLSLWVLVNPSLKLGCSLSPGPAKAHGPRSPGTTWWCYLVPFPMPASSGSFAPRSRQGARPAYSFRAEAGGWSLGLGKSGPQEPVLPTPFTRRA